VDPAAADPERQVVSIKTTCHPILRKDLALMSGLSDVSICCMYLLHRYTGTVFAALPCKKFIRGYATPMHNQSGYGMAL
jgi:hypothetical protein